MTQQQAENIQQEILSICNKHGLWSKVELERKPGLKMIKVEVSIKVDN